MQYASDTFFKAMFRRYISKWNSYLVYLCVGGRMQRILQERRFLVYTVFLSSKIVTPSPKRSSQAFLPRGKTVVKRVRSDGIIP